MGVSSEALQSKDVLDIFLEIDSQFYVDPFLLRKTEIPEFKRAYLKIQNHFKEVIKILKIAEEKSGRFYEIAVKKLKFPEYPYISLGHCQGLSSGRGIGIKRAEKIASSAFDIIHAGIDSPTIFELIGIFEDGIGPDLISDLTICLIQDEFVDFSMRVSLELNAKTHKFRYTDKSIKELPFLWIDREGKKKREPRLLVPKSLLRKIPVFQDWSDIQKIKKYNQATRAKVNKLLSGSFSEALSELTTSSSGKDFLKSELFADTQKISELVDIYEDREEEAYDFQEDPLGEMIWYENAQRAVSNSSIGSSLKLSDSPRLSDIEEIIERVCCKFATLLADNGLCHTLWFTEKSDDKSEKKAKPKLRNERYAQLLFFAVADSYCDANNLDISRESNAGRGPVDFKFSRGRSLKINVEIKYSNNPKLIPAYERQLPQYNQSEKVSGSIYLVICVSKETPQITKLTNLYNRQIAEGKKAPKVILAKGFIQPSASNL